MSERLLDHSLRLIAYIESQAALGVSDKDIENAIKSTSIEQLEADAAAKAAAASAAAAAATAPSGTPSTPPTLPASPPLGTPPTPPALPTSGTPPTLPALPTSGTPPTLPALPPSGTPGSSSFNNWYEEIAVSRLSNSTPSDVQAPTLDQPGINNVTNTTVTDAPSSTPSEIQTPDLGAPNAPQSNNSILLETCSVNENHNTNYGFCLPESSKASTTVLPTGSIKQWFYKDPLLYWIQINTQTQTSNSKALILLSSVDISTNHTKSGSNNITNSTNVTTLSETHSTTPFEVQTPALDQPGINNVTNTTVTDAPNALQSNNSTLLKTCSVNENHNTNYGFYLPEFSKALTVLHTGAIKQGFYKPSQTNTASSLNTPSDYNTNSLFNSFQVNTQTQTSNSTPFIHIYDLIKNAPSSKFNNITNSTNFTNSNDLPTNNTESDHDSFTSNNLYKLLGDTSSHLNSNIKFFSPLGTALVVYRQFEMNYSLSEEVRKILPRSNVDISTNHTQSESNNITNSTNVTTLSETPSGNTTLSGAPLTPPGSSSIKKWYEEIQVSGLSNSTPSNVQAPTLNSTSAPSKIETLGNSTDQSKSTCLDGIDYINAPTASTLKSNLECFAQQFNSTQECIIHMWGLNTTDDSSTVSYIPKCDNHQGTTQFLCKAFENTCESIYDIDRKLYKQCHQEIKNRHHENTYLIERFYNDCNECAPNELVGHQHIVNAIYCGLLFDDTADLLIKEYGGI